MKAKSVNVLQVIFTLLVCLVGAFFLFSVTNAYADVETKTVGEVAPSMLKGASIRISDKYGLRYTMYMSQSDYDGLMANVGADKEYKKVTFGVLVAPEYYEDAFGAMNAENLFGNAAVYDWADISGTYTGTNGQGGGKVRIINAEGTKMSVPTGTEQLPTELQDQEIVLFNGSVVDFKSTANTLLNYKGVGYICGEEQDGTLSYKLATANDNLRSMVYVAQKAVEAGGANADAISATYLTDEVKNTDVDYSVEYYLENSAGEFVKDNENSSTVKGKIDSTANISPIENLNGYIHLDNASDVLSGKIYANGSTVLKYYYRKLYVKEFDLNGGKTLNVTSALSSLDIASGTLESVSIINQDGSLTPYETDGNPAALTNVEGKENVLLLFEGTNKTSVVSAKIYTLKIGSWSALRQMGTILNNNKVASASGGYISGGYFVLTADITSANNQEDFSPALYIKDSAAADNGFNGVFDGQGFSIEKIRTYSQRNGTGDNAGLCAWGMFSSLASGGVIKNVSISAGPVNDTNTLFGKHCHGTVENVRIHVKQATFAGEQGPLFNYAPQSGAVIRNVFVTFGDGVKFNGSRNGLFAAYANANITIEGLYVVGEYTCSNGGIITWNKDSNSNTNMINAMTRNAVKYGAYFASTEDFAAGIETIAGVKQASVGNFYKDQIASLFDADIWDLTGDLPEFKD